MRSHRILPSFDEENILRNKGYQYIAGVDEVGRGCFAGPVVSAAVILPSHFDQITSEINDSKLLSPYKREELSEVIKKHALAYAISLVHVGVINAYGIGKATQISFRKAIKSLPIEPDFILIDAFYIDGIAKSKQKPIIHGDRKSISVAAASILAKVYRDDLMRKLDGKYLVYDFAANKGYGTRRHQEAIQLHGLSNLHRTSFNLTKFTLQAAIS
jgi:ribonuclease HII